MEGESAVAPAVDWCVAGVQPVEAEVKDKAPSGGVSASIVRAPERLVRVNDPEL